MLPNYKSTYRGVQSEWIPIQLNLNELESRNKELQIPIIKEHKTKFKETKSNHSLRPENGRPDRKLL